MYKIYSTSINRQTEGQTDLLLSIECQQNKINNNEMNENLKTNTRLQMRKSLQKIVKIN